MALSRREFELLREQVVRLENRLRALEERVKVTENVLKPENILRRVRDGEAEERRKLEEQEKLDKLLGQGGSGASPAPP
ncbi:MAG TPA: hypothetical protein VNO81_14770 [Candidatus Nitrosotenuis sp.]|jgi:predicted  nucleic acid-binding Zn-ribbon protein|nr:hypothetical protein [Candidatus Nitrosotenuis sp.]